MPWVCVDAGIGAGKSTLLDMISERLPKMVVLKEPVGDDSGPGEWDPFLRDMYEGLPGSHFTFQKRVVQDRALSDEVTRIGTSDTEWGILERSPEMQRRTFTRLGALSESEVQEIDAMYGQALWKPACIVYLRVEPAESHARMQSRGRAAERGVDVGLHEKLFALHEAAVCEIHNIPVHVVEATRANPEDVYLEVERILHRLSETT